VVPVAAVAYQNITEETFSNLVFPHYRPSLA